LPLLYGMAACQWLIASIIYRLVPVDRFPKPLIDLKRKSPAGAMPFGVKL
jgi:hypothetical protein